jgi:hypothetical protein
VDVPADSARIVRRIDWELPQGGGLQLTCQLVRDGRTLAANEYDLAIHDDLQPTFGQWLRARLASLVRQQ